MADLSQEIGVVPGGGRPWGLISNDSAAKTDAAGSQILGIQGKQLLQQQREQYAQKAAALKKAQEDQDAINAKIRGADVPLVHQKYNDARNATMDFEKNSNNLDRNTYLNRQQQVNQKWADVNKLISQSVQGKAQDAEDIKNQSDPKNSMDYADDAHTRLAQRVNTPINQWSNAPVLDNNEKPVIDENGKAKIQDLGDPTSYRYTKKEDYTKILSDATGDGKGKLTGGVVVGNPNAINRTENSFIGINSPYQISSTLASTIPTDNEKLKLKAADRVKDFKFQHKDISDADIVSRDKAYNEQYLTDPNVKAAYGFNGNEQFATTGDPVLDKYIKFDAQTQAMLHPPVKDTKRTTNEAAKTAEDHNFEIYKIHLNHDLKNGDDNAAASSINDGFDAMYKGNGNKVTTKLASVNGQEGVNEVRDIISAPLDFRKQFTAHIGAGKGVIPDAIVKRPNGNLVGVYYQRYQKEDENDGHVAGEIKKADNGAIPARTDITPVELDPNSSRLAFAKGLGGTKAVDALSKQKNNSNYTIGGKKYSNNDLKKMGYSDDQINQAIKLGTIKQ